MSVSRRRWVNFLPALSPRVLAGLLDGGRLPAPLDADRSTLTFSARHAIWKALGVLDVKPDDNILMPSYCCGCEFLPMLRYPVQVRFYNIRWPMDVDLDHLSRMLDGKSRAVFCTSYVGFPHNLEEVRRFCSERGLYMIENSVHSLYGRVQGRHLGTLGDIGIFSMRKTIPATDGGALVINDRALRLDRPGVRPGIWDYAGKAKHLLGMYVRARFRGRDLENLMLVRRIVRSLKSCRGSPSAGFDVSLEKGSFDPRTGDYSISWLGEALCKAADGTEVVRRRRENYQFILDHLEGIEGVRPLFPALPEGICPLFCPVVVADSNAYTLRMVARGVEAIPFWYDDEPRIPKELFPDTYRLKKSVLAIPIHQDLEAADMAHIIRILRQVASEIPAGNGGASPYVQER